MKTAYQWLKDRLDGTFGDGIDLDGHIYTAAEWDKRHIEMYKAIQLDAMKEGARRAAEIVNAYPQTISIISANKDILATADRWTTKDL